MSVERSTELLWDRLCALREPFVALSVTVWEDRPANEEQMIADSVGDTVTEARGWLEGASGALMDVRQRSDAIRLRHMAVCSEQFDHLERTFWSELCAYERMDAVVTLGHERHTWAGWSAEVRRSIVDCAGLLHEARSALLACWESLALSSATPAVSVNATNIGQQVAAPTDSARREKVSPSAATHDPER
jgi:hypothetical protein